jgi:hypothetical protein
LTGSSYLGYSDYIEFWGGYYESSVVIVSN